MTPYQLANKDDPEYKAKNNTRTKLWYQANKQKALARRKERFLENHEQEKAKNRQAYWDNREERMAARRLHYLKNRERALESYRKYAIEHADEMRFRARQWAKDHPFERRLQHAMRRTKIKGIKIIKEEICNWETRLCGICSEFIENDFHIDHATPLSRGGKHEVTNLQLTHPICNLRKNNKLPSEFTLQGAT